ncbi:GFA family protein [Rhizobium sp. TRM96647]|uniref:GFA family protein n=1 Tax=unclassified Rhizobium TaxID=2613769 RepID=UPI003996BE90
MAPVQAGGCRCGCVTCRLPCSSERIGICHCTDCREESGSAFTFFGVWPASAFSTTATGVHRGRHFCPNGGSRLFSYGEIAPTALPRTHELWIKRREPWLAPVRGVDQCRHDRVISRA